MSGSSYIGAQILKDTRRKNTSGFVTNNPDKVYQFERFIGHGNQRARADPDEVTPYDLFYLRTKQVKDGAYASF